MLTSSLPLGNYFFFFQAEDGIRDLTVTGVQTCALPISRKTVVGLGRVIPIATALFGAGLIAFSFSRVLWLAVPSLVIAGFGFMVQVGASNTILSMIVDEEKRGRVMSFYMIAFL